MSEIILSEGNRMNITDFAAESEKPLERLLDDGGFCGIFRTIGCIGDSLSSGEFESTGADGGVCYHDMFEYSWGQFMARIVGNTAYNFSRGGMTAKAYMESFAQTSGFFDKSLACQAYVIALGVNDNRMINSGRLEYGNKEDIDLSDYRNNRKTMYGYYASVIQKYKEIQPEAFFFLVTIPKKNPSEDWRTVLEGKHRDMLYEMAELFPKTFVLDLREYAPEYDSIYRRDFKLGGHKNPMGYVLMAKMAVSYIDYIIRHNMEEFAGVPFIGTGLTF